MQLGWLLCGNQIGECLRKGGTRHIRPEDPSECASRPGFRTSTALAGWRRRPPDASMYGQVSSRPSLMLAPRRTLRSGARFAGRRDRSTTYTSLLLADENPRSPPKPKYLCGTKSRHLQATGIILPYCDRAELAHNKIPRISRRRRTLDNSPPWAHIALASPPCTGRLRHVGWLPQQPTPSRFLAPPQSLAMAGSLGHHAVNALIAPALISRPTPPPPRRPTTDPRTGARDVLPNSSYASRPSWDYPSPMAPPRQTVTA